MGMFGGIAVSKKGTLSFGWELFLPRIDTVSEDRYNAYIEAYSSALRVLPEWTVVHRQDIYTYDSYKPERKAGDGFLKRCSDAHFDGRPFLTHKAYLFVTYASRGLIRKDGKSSGLFGLSGSGERPGTDTLRGFYSKCSEFMQILSTMGGVASRELTTRDWLGEGLRPGIIQRYMTLGGDEPYMSDIAFTPDAVRVNGKQGLAFTLGESSYLPIEISDVSKNEALSGFGTEVLESSGAKIGPMLDCEHVVNNYIVIPPQGEVQRELEAKYRRMNASISARENAANIGEIDGFLTAWKKYGLFAVGRDGPGVEDIRRPPVDGLRFGAVQLQPSGPLVRRHPGMRIRYRRRKPHDPHREGGPLPYGLRDVRQRPRGRGPAVL